LKDGPSILDFFTLPTFIELISILKVDTLGYFGTAMLRVARVDDDRKVKRRCSCRFIIDFVRVLIRIEAVPEG
jgi:hypothetical protein